jgi:hypothetical protein
MELVISGKKSEFLFFCRSGKVWGQEQKGSNQGLMQRIVSSQIFESFPRKVKTMTVPSSQILNLRCDQLRENTGKSESEPRSAS